MYVYMYVCAYMNISMYGPGYIYVDVLSVCMVVCILCMNHSSTSPILSEDRQIKPEPRLKRHQFYDPTF